MKPKFFILYVLLSAIIILTTAESFAFVVPKDNSKVEYFYVFGPEGNPQFGAEDNELVLYIDVPEDEFDNVVISVFDPDTSGMKDLKEAFYDDWNTVTEFAVYGDELLDKNSFDKEYDYKYFKFGPYDKTKGKKVDDMYRFRLEAIGIEGNDVNLFKVKISPESAEVFSYNLTFRLLPHKGDMMYFYVQIPAGIESIIVENYDIDENGGMSALFDPVTVREYRVKDSRSGHWEQTFIPIASDKTRYLKYSIEKKTQRYAHAGLRIKDDKDNTLPIYVKKMSFEKVPTAPKFGLRLRPGTKPCNTFTFDATKSYDPDNQNLTFHWDFGDSEESTEPVVTHIYKEGGEYKVTLTVKDDSGLICDTASTTKVVKVNTPPDVSFTVPGLVCVGEEITFNASSTKDYTSENLSFYWEFGDGTKAEGERTTKIYRKGGTYEVILVVDDNEDTTCSVATMRKTIHANTPPVADAGKDIAKYLDSFEDEYKVTFNGSRSKDADNDNLVYIWDFGDGEEGIGKEVNHVYEKSGVYEVKLTVDDGIGSTCSTDTDIVKVNLNKAPKAVIKMEDQKICVGEKAVFDGTTSLTESGETLTYKWDFGDGTTAEGEKAEHVYEKGGAYSVTLVVDDGKGTPCSIAKSSMRLVINSKPVVKLKSIDTVCVGKKVNFDASGSRDPDSDNLQYIWDFGDGTVEKGASKTSHIYKKGGEYEVGVIVDDGKGFSCSRASKSISVKVNTSPIAKIDAITKCCVGMEMNFDASGSRDPDGDKLTYKWDFGDGTVVEGGRVTHIFKDGGKYKVILTIDDGKGTECSQSKATLTINVSGEPVPVIEVR